VRSEDPLELVLAKLTRLSTMDREDRAAIASLPYRLQHAAPGHLLVREGDVPRECCVLVEGYACRHKGTSHGARQIVSFHLPGDILDVQHLQLPKADHNVETITAAQIAWISTGDLRALLAQHPRINDALWRDALVDASIFREWVLNIGRRDAKSRIAHMLCEFAARRQAAGLGSPERFEIPMTQEQIADATGLTSVHVNRSLQALGAAGVIERTGREIRIANWRRMCDVADFDPAYLHQAA
jgi:CRP-like cAMP-binding protein